MHVYIAISGFKFQTDQGFWIQISKRARFRIQISKRARFKIQISNFLGFKFQSNFLGFIFQSGLDSGFRFQIGGIQDSDLGLQGPIISTYIIHLALTSRLIHQPTNPRSIPRAAVEGVTAWDRQVYPVVGREANYYFLGPHRVQYFRLRAHLLYSTVDGSRPWLFLLVGKKKNKICLHVHVGGKKKIKGKLTGFVPKNVGMKGSFISCRREK